MAVEVTTAVADDAAELADVAARTFPLACPPSVAPRDSAAFIAENLSQDRFREYVDDPDRVVLAAREGGRIIGYAMLIRDDDAVELSKIYVLPDRHGSGAADALMTAALRAARRLGGAAVWLGVNQNNHRAQRFYAKHGFDVAGTRTFRVGAAVENDYVMKRPL